MLVPPSITVLPAASREVLAAAQPRALAARQGSI